MGKFDFDFDNEITRQLEKLSNYDEIAEKMLSEAVPKIEENVKKEVAKHQVSGEMLESIKSSKPKKNQYGWFVTVFPSGKDKKGVRNGEKLAYLEYGTANQSAQPVLTKAINDSRAAVNKILQDIFNREVGGSS